MELSPKTKRQAETEQAHIVKSFKGMMKDIPASELPEGYSAKNDNIYDYGSYSEARAGYRKYNTADSSLLNPAGTLRGVLDHIESGFIIKIYGSYIYLVNKQMESYIKVLNISGVIITDEWCNISPLGPNAVIYSKSGILLIVLNDYFYYARRLNQTNPVNTLTDIIEILPSDGVSYNNWGYRYTYSLLQKKGNSGVWNRLTAGFPPVFESATCTPSSEGKDYGEKYYYYENYYSPTKNTYNALGNTELQVPAGVYDVTHFGVYRTKNIGHNSTPPGIDPVRGIGNNAALFVWSNDVPVAKSFYMAISNRGANPTLTITVTQGQFAFEDIGSVLTLEDGLYGLIHKITDTTTMKSAEVYMGITHEGDALPTQPTIIDEQACAIGGGRVCRGYQDGVIVFSDNGLFVSSDVGKPIFWPDGRVSWIEKFITTQKVQVANDDTIVQSGFTIAPLSGNFSRGYGDASFDDGTQYQKIGLQQRIESGQPIYWPNRFFSPLPNANIGVIDLGFMITALRDDTTFYYSQVGVKPYCAGYYRADIQREEVDSLIRDIWSLASTVMIIMKSQTRSINPGVAVDLGNATVAESVFQIPPSFLVDDKRGVIAWQSIQSKGLGTIMAVTNEPAMRYLTSSGWSAENFAKDQVQKDLSAMDPYQKVVSVYLPTKKGGYKIWFTKKVRA